MKKKWIRIVCDIIILIVLLWVGLFFWYKYNNQNQERVPEYLKGWTCGGLDWWECPQWFLEEKGLTGDTYSSNWYKNLIYKLPEWWEEAGCIERWTYMPCKDFLN
jgi:hypothetical protein